MTALTDMADLSIEDGIAIITIDNPPVKKGPKKGPQSYLFGPDH